MPVVMGKASRNSENIFKWPIHKDSDRLHGSIKHNNNKKNTKKCFHTYSTYSIIPTSEVTQGAVEVWATLPDEIRQDPALASFRQEHERIHGGYMQYLMFFFFIIFPFRNLSFVYRWLIIIFNDSVDDFIDHVYFVSAHFNKSLFWRT